MRRTMLDDLLHPDTVCLTFDVEWAAQPVVDDIRQFLDAYGVMGTFFVTHAGVNTGGHERALHPNFRRNGDVYRLLSEAASRSDIDVYRHVLETFRTFAPEARGTRSHSLFFDSLLLPIYQSIGIEYDATLRLDLVSHLQPFWKPYNIVAIPTYYADYFDLTVRATGFRVAGLNLESPGLKVLDFHPNVVYANVADLATYESLRPFSADPERLRSARSAGLGARTLFVEVLETIAARKLPTATLAEINAAMRTPANGRDRERPAAERTNSPGRPQALP